MEPTLIIITGDANSGKTTFARKLQKEGIVDVYYEVDSYVCYLKGSLRVRLP